MSKVISFENASATLRPLQEQGKVIVQCHGTFDLLHPGHIIHFEEAKACGDLLVVTVTADAYVNKGPGRPYFNDDLRLTSIASLGCVDYVILVPYPAAVEAIECVHPDVYCKGKEYQDPAADVTANILDDVVAVKRMGGRVEYVGSVVFSSTKLLNSYFETYDPEVKALCSDLTDRHGVDGFRDAVAKLDSLRVLVVGDIIVDRYTTVEVQGLTSKDRILSVRYDEESAQAGGALAVYRHVKAFASQVNLFSLAGNETWADEFLHRYLGENQGHILRESGFTTVVKQRFVEPLKEGKELSKLFSVNVINARRPDESLQRTVRDRLADIIDDYDVIMVMDFGHGLLEPRVRDLAQDRAKFLALNCQTNSNNHGYNIINQQYRRADSFSLDERELCLACGRREPDYAAELEALRDELGAAHAWLTRGGTETIGVEKNGSAIACPPFEQKVVDTVGAGDAFSAIVSLAAATGVPLDLATFMGQLAGAQAVRLVGNQSSISKSSYLKAGLAMLTR